MRWLMETIEPRTAAGKPRGYVVWVCGCWRMAPYYECGMYVSELRAIDPKCTATHGPLEIARSRDG